MLSGGKSSSNLNISQQAFALRRGSLPAVPRPYRRLRGVEVNEVLIHEAALFVCQRHISPIKCYI